MTSVADVSAALGRELAALSHAEIPSAAIEKARALVLDGAACLIAGTREFPAAVARDYAATVVGRREASAAGLATEIDVAGAAFVNGVTMHCLDFEAVGVPPCHGTSSVLPALLAVAERDGRSGRDVLTAFVFGWEVECRLRTVGQVRKPFHPTAVFGPVAAAAATAVLLGLDGDGIEAAIAIATSSAGGMIANGRTAVKAFHAGNAARTGVQSATLAALGLSGAAGVLERDNGYAEAFLVDHCWDGFADGWGERFFLVEPGVNFKPYPVQFPMINVVDAALDAKAYGFDADDVSRVDITAARRIASRSNPRPHGGHAGKFSPEYCAAVTFVRGVADIDSFTDEAASDPRLISMLGRVAVHTASDAANRDYVALRVGLRDGRTVEIERKHHRGSITEPLERSDLATKVAQCLRYSGRGGDTDALIAVAERFETPQDVRELAGLLRAGGH